MWMATLERRPRPERCDLVRDQAQRECCEIDGYGADVHERGAKRPAAGSPPSAMTGMSRMVATPRAMWRSETAAETQRVGGPTSADYAEWWRRLR